MILQDHQDQHPAETGVTFEEFLKQEVRISKQFFYEQMKAYELCLEYKQPELYKEVGDYKALVQTARIKDQKLQKKIFNEIKKQPDINR